MHYEWRRYLCLPAFPVTAGHLVLLVFWFGFCFCFSVQFGFSSRTCAHISLLLNASVVQKRVAQEKPDWESRLCRKIESQSSNISRVSCYLRFAVCKYLYKLCPNHTVYWIISDAYTTNKQHTILFFIQ